ncbi:MAG: DNA primase [Acidobacteria bacterium RIFCSPLOWO2_12_FULL_67_14]|nr:MAG: DNA primase [Acidobacteria bacterium RIFCSPLOWO2_02_FULL_67_21]OFW39918.1 MAG: DNA primase [Acidobacteria bacterium RIFCSPLOWO2_12_FULL_67_14]
MALFPQQFIDDLKQHADIVVVIQDYVSLKKSGATYKGLCPFHGEKTPSFHVNRDKGFFHCFGCGAGGDVFKFLELRESVAFPDAVRMLAQRFGMTPPEVEQSDAQRASTAERESLLKAHEAAAAWFRQQLGSPAGARVLAQIAARGITPATSDVLGLGFAPPARDALKQALTGQGFSQALLVRAGLLVQRDDGGAIDRFRNRLMIPIARETGSVIAFGGRATEPDQQPKYLNSPETPIYTKSRTLYGVNLSKAAIRESGFAILVEGYFDYAQLFQAGFQSVVASCGTALTPPQAQQLRRFTPKVVLSFDPDAAGQGAAAKSCEMLVAEGFEVNVAILPAGEDPDTYVRTHGRQGYAERLRTSRPYLEYLLDRAAARHNLRNAEGRARFVAEVLPIVERIPDRTRQELFVEAVAGKAGVAGDSIWAQVSKAVTHRGSSLTSSELPALGQVTKAEKGLIWWLVHRPEQALAALQSLDPGDLEGLATRSVLDLAVKLTDDRGFSPSVLLERLNRSEAQLVTGIASEREPHVHDVSACALILRRLRYERERAALQREIDRLQQNGAAGPGDELQALLVRKYELIQRIDELA